MLDNRIVLENAYNDLHAWLIQKYNCQNVTPNNICNTTLDIINKHYGISTITKMFIACFIQAEVQFRKNAIGETNKLVKARYISNANVMRAEHVLRVKKLISIVSEKEPMFVNFFTLLFSEQ